jgi:hypothetical protein
MYDRNAQLELISDLEARHDELLSRLDDLDKRVAKTLAECSALRGGAVVGEKTSAGVKQ